MNRIALAVLFAIFAIAGLGAQALPRILSLKVTPAKIHPGDEVTVTWTTRDTESVAIEWRSVTNPGAVSDTRSGLPPAGSFRVRLVDSAVFVLSCQNAAGLCSRSVTATVKVTR